MSTQWPPKIGITAIGYTPLSAFPGGSGLQLPAFQAAGGGTWTLASNDLVNKIQISAVGIGFYGITPVAKAGAVASPAQTGVAVAATAATNVGPYGYAQAQADAIRAAVNASVVDIAALKVAVDALRVALQGIGITA